MYLHFIDRKTAKERGFVHYFLFSPCRNGHISERNTKSSTCMVCEKERKKEYREKHPEKARESLRKSRIKHLEQRRLDNKVWREKNSDSLRESKRNYVINNREKVRQSKRRYYEENKERLLKISKEHRSKNKDRYTEMEKKWRAENKELVRTMNRNRKARIKNAEGRHTKNDIEKIFLLQKGRCAGCGLKLSKSKYHVDHIVPLILGGSNWPSNLQVMCQHCNTSKGGKPPGDFYMERGFLL